MQRKKRGRPCLRKKINFQAQIKYFKPQGVPAATLDIIELNKEELEALRLKNIEGFDQITSAKKMQTSQSSFQRILTQAYQKISDALVNGKAIQILD